MNMIPFFFSSSSHSRLITLISLLLFNPLPFISTLPTASKLNEHSSQFPRLKRQTYLTTNDFDHFPPKEELLFQGLLGCKYDSDVCNQNEACFDDQLFGQCWDGQGSERQAFALENGLGGLTDEKVLALEYTLDFLRHYHLDWKDYMTQCILSHVLSDHHRYRLQIYYNDCLNKDAYLDKLAALPKDLARGKKFVYYDSDEPVVVKRMSVHRKKFNERFLHQTKPQYQYPSVDYDSNRLSQEIVNSMSKPRKVPINMNEGYPGLVETLQINNNRQPLSLVKQPIMSQDDRTKEHQALTSDNAERFFTVETARGYIIINRDFHDQTEGARLLGFLVELNAWPPGIFKELNTNQRILTFHVLDNAYRINASNVANSALIHRKTIEKQLGIRIIDSGIGNPSEGAQLSVERQNASHLPVITLATCAAVLFIMASFAMLYYIKRHDRIRNKMAELTGIKGVSTDCYQNLCRERMQSQPKGRTSTEAQPICPSAPVSNDAQRHSESSSSRSSTSSWSEEPVPAVDMDIMTGHLILSYMEDHLCNRHRLETEWQSLCIDEATDEESSCSVALSETNERKNRNMDCIPYDHTRIRLTNSDDGDYINASAITDSDPKCKYIATQGPMVNTTNAFWQMVWEQGSCVIVALARPIENGITMCHHYWPVEGSARFDDFEVNLVSEHIWSDDYIVRSFYLKNLQTMETRTVTQFHFLTWDESCNPSTKSVLDFRRKVNKCFRGQSSPIIIHCNDGVGRTGTYILLDIVLNRIYKGAREINIVATLEHVRDQRAKMVKTKDQLEFVFNAVAEEVTYLLKSLPQ